MVISYQIMSYRPSYMNELSNYARELSFLAITYSSTLCFPNSFESILLFIYYKNILLFFCTCSFPVVSGSWLFQNLVNAYHNPYPDPGNLGLLFSFEICYIFQALTCP